EDNKHLCLFGFAAAFAGLAWDPSAVVGEDAVLTGTTTGGTEVHEPPRLEYELGGSSVDFGPSGEIEGSPNNQSPMQSVLALGERLVRLQDP
ncbi:unnamed protein product, partial [Amoebophrya sp. A120]